MGSSCSAQVSGAHWGKSGHGSWCLLCLGCGVESVTGMLVSPWSGWGFLRNDVSEALTGFKHFPSAPALLFHLPLGTASELPTPSMTSHNSLSHGATGALCVHSRCSQRWGRAPRAELRLCHGPRPTLSLCHRPGLSERDHHRNHQDQQPGRTLVLREYPWDPQGPESLTAAGKGAALQGGEGFGATLKPVSAAPECLSCRWGYPVTTGTKGRNKSWPLLGPGQGL